LKDRDGYARLLGEVERNRSDKRRAITMKMRIRVTLHNEDDSEATEATTMEVEVPDFEVFTGPDTFGEIFDQYEQKALEARNEVMGAVTEKYLGGMAKKTVRAKAETERR
jgi:hypothetical protein